MALNKKAQRDILNDYLRALTTYWPDNFMDVTKQHTDITLDQIQTFIHKHEFTVGDEYSSNGIILRKRFKLDEHQIYQWADKYLSLEKV